MKTPQKGDIFTNKFVLDSLKKKEKKKSIMDEFCRSLLFGPEVIETNVHLVLSVLHFITGLLSTSFNAIIVYAIWKTPSLRKPSMVLILGLAISDICTGSVSQPLNILFFQMKNLGGTLPYCIVGILSQGMSLLLGAMSGVTLMFISIDRLLAIKMGTKYKNLVTTRRVVCGFLILLCVCFIIAILLLTSGSLFLMFLMITIVGPIVFFVIVAVNFKAFRSLRKITVETNLAKIPTHSAANVKKFKETLWTIAIFVGLYTMFYIPYVVHAIYYLFNPTLTSSSQVTFYDITVFFMSLNSLANPFLYLWRIKQIREAVESLYLIRFCRRRNDNVAHITIEVQ